ncbi:anthranilate synthase component I family protein [Microbacterium marinilacus]|uniref:Chorismate-utilising enzyme C-terminal domain-containing protein n=1 Tax=Microbacterium marinilacus TaxID=415209 RepID=A0ABP7B2J8_9MICO|nr:anthranilate synthase component I family protein [Microbacterium marinilacus]MBY0688678.1 anthranilate synthase component I family protein [Microbacterium marinilacus]
MSDGDGEGWPGAPTGERWAWLQAGDGGPELVRLDPMDVSLSYDAASRRVTRHADGRSEVVGDDVFAALGEELAAGRPEDRWYGYLGYAARPDLPARPDGRLPDAVWMRPSHLRRQPAPAPAPGEISAPEHAATPDWYAVAFSEVQEQLHAGNSYEVNLTYRAAVRSGRDPLDAFLRLSALNPAPYAAYVHHDVPGARAFVASSSPERYARVEAAGGVRTLEAKPIKGTTPRGATAEADAAASELLATDPRFRSENLMIVDLLRHDLSQVCEVGTVEVPTLMAVESYASVHQLVSTVRGALRDDVGTVAALRALFPAGSMTGAPKLRTMQIIEDVEETPRGVYAGALGWIGADGRADLGVVIRSLMTAGDGEYLLGTGGGITVQSQADDEYAESRWKAERLLRALRD